MLAITQAIPKPEPSFEKNIKIPIIIIKMIVPTVYTNISILIIDN